MVTTRSVRINVVQSVQDSGWYAEIWETNTGREVLSTEVYRTASEAIAAARTWAFEEGYKIL